MSPLLLFPGELFSGEDDAPTLAGQYVVKDIVLLTVTLVVALMERGAALMLVPDDISRNPA